MALSSTTVGLVCFGSGLLLAAAASRWIIVRHLRKVRIAERRARSVERLAEIGAMTGGLAHEIKNPLSTIGLNAQLLAEAIDELPIGPEEKGRVSRRISSLRREIDRLRGILTDFLRYAGNIKLVRVPVDLNGVVRELVDFFHPQAESQGVRLRDSLSPEPLVADLDAGQFKQAVLNLMLNAVQAMAGTEPGAARELILRSERAGAGDGHDEIRLHVIDTGPGIAADKMERIFEPYFTTKAGGTGLGLPTARRLIESHDGRLEVHSEPGKGTDFTVVIPALTPEPRVP